MGKGKYPTPRMGWSRQPWRKKKPWNENLELRQVRAAERNTYATAALSAALVLLSFLQWHTSESTARIQRAEAQPHFRINQSSRGGLNGFLPESFSVKAISGVADESESISSEIFLIRYWSEQLHINGMCRASSRTFYGYTGDMTSYAISEEAEKLLELSTKDEPSSDGYTIQPMWTMVDVSFTDIFGQPQHRFLWLIGGHSSQIPLSQFAGEGWTNMDLYFHLDKSGILKIFRVNDGPIPQECANALRLLSLRKGIQIASSYIWTPGSAALVTKDKAVFSPGDSRITTTNPHPLYMSDESGKATSGAVQRAGTTPSYALPSMTHLR